MSASVVAGCDAPPFLEFSQEVLDLVSLAIERLVVRVRDFPASARRDARFDAFGDQRLAECGAVVAAIGDEVFGGREGAEHEACALVIAHLAFREQHDDRTALAVADGVELGVQPAFGAPDTAGNSPFLSRLAAVRWAFRCGFRRKPAGYSEAKPASVPI